MFTVYIDDSGTDDYSRIVAGACCVSSVALWKKFERQWNEIGKKEGFRHFHMTEFAGCRPDEWCRKCNKGKKTEDDHPWRNWSNTKRKRVLKSLVDIIYKFVEFGHGRAITKKDYEDFVLNSELTELGSESIGKRYFTFTLQAIARRLVRWRTKRGLTHPMKYVFDLTDDPEQKEDIARLFIGWISSGLDAGITPTGCKWESRKFAVQLLSADMLAWASAKARAFELFPNGKMSEGMSKEAKMVLSIFAQGNKKFEITSSSREQLRDWAKEEIVSRRSRKGNGKYG